MIENQQSPNVSSPWPFLGYILTPLFFIPLSSAEGKDPFVRFHARQQLNLLVLELALWILSSILNGALFNWIWSLLSIFALALIVIGIMNASSKQQKPLPIIGGFKFIK